MLLFTNGRGQSIIAYYSGDARAIDQYPVGQLTHIIYSFCYLRGSRLYAGGKDSITIRKLVSLKKAHPSLKVLLSLGGWGGCRNCSGVFSTDEGRAAFAQSVREMIDHFGAD